jgi:hypothetical protein
MREVGNGGNNVGALVRDYRIHTETDSRVLQGVTFHPKTEH